MKAKVGGIRKKRDLWNQKGYRAMRPERGGDDFKRDALRRADD
jgi:hypothetical protein